MKTRLLILIFAITSIIFSCSAPKDILPEGNVKSLNTTGNDIAPVQLPVITNCDPCGKEFGIQKTDEEYGVKPSSTWLKDILGARLAKDAEAITFLTSASGFFSFAHPPDETAADALNIPLRGTIGGTDIFEFRKEGEKYIFNNLGQEINSLTWDSHPAAVMDENCNVLLVWSSDRKTEKGYSTPFSVLRKLDTEGPVYTGNSDLYYAFRINGVWSEPHNFADVTGNINSEKNEETPFMTCMCHSPYIFFSSNRNGDNDIYWTKLSVDFNNKTINVIQEPQPLPKDVMAGINSPNKEYFPYVPAPLSSEGDNYIYFSSNRFREHYPIDESKKTRLKNVGEYDIYKFKLPGEITCIPPKITYKVQILDYLNTGNIILNPIIRLTDISTNQAQTANDNPALFNLQASSTYTSGGGSLHDKINCESGADRTISHYAYRKISRLEPEIIRKDTVFEYNEIIPRDVKVVTDTIRNTITISSQDMNKLQTGSNMKIENVQVKGDSLVVSMLELTPRLQSAGYDTVKRTKKVPVEYIIEKYDTSMIKTDVSNLALSEKTVRNNLIKAPNLKEDILIEDTIYVWPQYYYYPPCEWKYVQHNVDYRRNVPYFQTGFWEVNTPENLQIHLKELKSKKFDDASFIELHPENMYFGYSRQSITEEQKKKRRVRYDNRVAEYRKFANQVDQNLDEMAYELIQTVLPTFEKLDVSDAGAQNKLIIIIHGFSDIRPIQKGIYIGDESVSFLSALYDTVSNSFTRIEPVFIPPGESMVGEDNDVLSKLRTYFGYREVIKKLYNSEMFMKYLARNEVLLPDQIKSKAEFDNRFKTSKIVFVLEGKRIDPTPYRIAGYVGEKGDFESLDPIRRINVVVKRVEVVGGIIKNPDCCRPVSDIPELIIK